LQLFKAKNVKLISFIGVQQDKDADKIGIAELLLTLHRLAISLLLNLQEGLRIELPGPSPDGLDLDRKGVARKVRGKHIEVRNVSCEWRREDTEATKLRDDKMLPDLAYELIAAFRFHFKSAND
jgi:hypothetical protein